MVVAGGWEAGLGSAVVFGWWGDGVGAGVMGCVFACLPPVLMPCAVSRCRPFPTPLCRKSGRVRAARARARVCACMLPSHPRDAVLFDRFPPNLLPTNPGTTNVLSLDLLRALAHDPSAISAVADAISARVSGSGGGGDAAAALRPVQTAIQKAVRQIEGVPSRGAPFLGFSNFWAISLTKLRRLAAHTLTFHRPTLAFLPGYWTDTMRASDPDGAQAGARNFAFAVARTYIASLLYEQVGLLRGCYIAFRQLMHATHATHALAEETPEISHHNTTVRIPFEGGLVGWCRRRCVCRAVLDAVGAAGVSLGLHAAQPPD